MIIDGKINLTPIEKKMYQPSFQNIAMMDDSEIISMLRKLDAFTIAVSMIDVNEDISQRIYKNLSQRAHEQIKAEVHRLSELDAKQMI